MMIGVSTHARVRGRFSPSPSYRWLSSCLRHSASDSRPFLPIRPVACCPGTMQEIKERYSKDLWLSETYKLRLKKNAHKELQYVDSKIGKKTVELGNVKNGINILSNHRPDIIHQVPTHTVTCIGSSSSMNESAVDNKHRQSVRPESRFTFQRPQLERPILNLQPPQYDRVAEVVNDVSGRTMHSEKCFINGQHIKTSTTGPPAKDLQKVVHQEKTTDVYDKVIVVDNVSTAKEVARLLITKYKDFIHACDTEVANINVKSDPK